MPVAELDLFAFNIIDLKREMQHRYDLFMHFYMGDLLIYEIPPFHFDVFSRMVSSTSSQCAFALPREHNKTTLAKLAVLYYFLYTDYTFIVYVSNTATIAQNACKDIVEFLECDNHRAAFGEIERLTWREGDGFYRFKMEDAEGNEKICILRALGAGQQVRGINIGNRRPELGVVDDLEDDDNTGSDILVKKLRNWVYGAFFKCFNRWKKKIIWLGNMLSTDSLLYHYCKDPDWDSMLYGAIKEDGTPLWPDLWPLEALQKDFKAYRRLNLTRRWYAEMMNMPMPPGAGLINADLLLYRPAVPCSPGHSGFITIDPAITRNTWSNQTAFVVHLWIDNCWQIVEVICEHIEDPIMIVNNAIDMALRWGLHVIGTEAASFQVALQPLFRYIFTTRGLDHFLTVGIPGGKETKVARLTAWCALLANGSYTLTEDDMVVTRQLMIFDPAKQHNDDDAIDACARGTYMIQNYLPEIMQSFALPGSSAVIQGSYETCPI